MFNYFAQLYRHKYLIGGEPNKYMLYCMIKSRSVPTPIFDTLQELSYSETDYEAFTTFTTRPYATPPLTTLLLNTLLQIFGHRPLSPLYTLTTFAISQPSL